MEKKPGNSSVDCYVFTYRGMVLTRQGFASLALGHLEEIAAYSRRLTGNPAEGEDLVQSVFERAFGAWRELRDPRQCRLWLFRIARNAHLDRVRAVAARPELRLVQPDDAVAPEPMVFPETVARLDAHDLELALCKVAPEQAEAVLLCDLWGFEYPEIAEITGSPIGTVRSRIARGRARLAALLRETGTDQRKGRP